MDDDKHEKENSNKNSKNSKKSKGKEGLNDKMNIIPGDNTSGKDLNRPMINSKKYTPEMENKLKNMNKDGEKLDLGNIEINNNINIEEKKSQNNEDKKEEKGNNNKENEQNNNNNYN